MPAIPFEQFRRKSLGLYPENVYAGASIRAVLQVLREFDELRTKQGRKIVRSSADLTSEAISAWLAAHARRSPARNQSLLRTLRPMLVFAVKSGYLPKAADPFELKSPNKWAWPSSKAMPRRSPMRSKAADQVGVLLRMLDDEASLGWKQARLRALGYSAAFTGLRAREILTLPVACVDLGRRALRVVETETWAPKTIASARAQPIADPLADVLREWIPMCGCAWVFPGVRRVGPWTSGAPGTKALDEIKAAARRAGIGDFTILGFRKTLATHATFMGITDDERRRQLGHTTVETARRWYEEPVIEEMRPVVNKIRYPMPASGPSRPRLRVV